MLERGERYDWWESRFVTMLAFTSLLSGIALIWHELTTDEPVINFRILKSRQVTAGVSIGLLLGFALYGSVFILPVFLQQLLQMTAWQTGKIILPGAIASAITMAVVGRNAMRLDARYTVVAGAFLFFASMLKLSHLTSASGSEDLFWPLILRGMGLGLIFVPLTNATMADLKVKDLAQGTGMFNLMRQLGGSLGIAVMATLLARFMAAEKAVLVEHVGANDPETLSRLSLLARGLVSRGINPMVAQQQALAILDRQVTVQSSMLAFSRIYLYSGLVLICGLPLLLLFRTGRARGSMGPVH
jgi:DHA2 family multidrug resistance protein